MWGRKASGEDRVWPRGASPSWRTASAGSGGGGVFAPSRPPPGAAWNVAAEAAAATAAGTKPQWTASASGQLSWAGRQRRQETPLAAAGHHRRSVRYRLVRAALRARSQHMAGGAAAGTTCLMATAAAGGEGGAEVYATSVGSPHTEGTHTRLPSFSLSPLFLSFYLPLSPLAAIPQPAAISPLGPAPSPQRRHFTRPSGLPRRQDVTDTLRSSLGHRAHAERTHTQDPAQDYHACVLVAPNGGWLSTTRAADTRHGAAAHALLARRRRYTHTPVRPPNIPTTRVIHTEGPPSIPPWRPRGEEGAPGEA